MIEECQKNETISSCLNYNIVSLSNHRLLKKKEPLSWMNMTILLGSFLLGLLFDDIILDFWASTWGEIFHAAVGGCWRLSVFSWIFHWLLNVSFSPLFFQWISLCITLFLDSLCFSLSIPYPNWDKNWTVELFDESVD